jgi:integrase
MSVPTTWREAIESLRGAYAEVTLVNCHSVWRDFETWCSARGEPALPASAETVAAYVQAIFGRLAASTVRTRLCEIRRVHRAVGAEDPTRSYAVMLACRRGLRTFGAAVRQAGGLTESLRDRLLSACTDDLLGRRDAVMITLGYDTLSRACELVALRLEDLTVLPEGGASILVRRAKNDSAGLGQLGYLSPNTLDRVRAWAAAAGISDGPILRPLDGGVCRGRQMHKQVVSYRLKILARRAGVDERAARITGHSLRVGAAQDLARSGRTLVEIMRAGRWRFIESVTDYTRHAPVNVWAPGDGDLYATHRDVQARVRRHQRRSLAATGHPPSEPTR